MAADFLPSERELTRSEEEEKLLRDIREEKERLWLEIQVGKWFKSGAITWSSDAVSCFQDLRRQIIDIDNELAALDEANDEWVLNMECLSSDGRASIIEMYELCLYRLCSPGRYVLRRISKEPLEQAAISSTPVPKKWDLWFSYTI